jgi:hypothetical protein
VWNIIVDEWFDVLETLTIDLETIPQALGATTAAWRKEVEPWARSLMAQAPDEKARAKALEASETPGTNRVPSFDTTMFNAEAISATFEPVKWAQDIRRAAHPSARYSFAEGKCVAVRLSDMAAYLKDHGGTVLAAGLPIPVLKALRPDAITRQIDVEDPPGVEIERVRVIMADATTKVLKRDRERVARVVEDLLRRRPLASTVIICAKRLEPWVLECIAGCPGVEVTHYGAVRGMDTWMDFEVFATIGDHYENLGAVDQEATYFGLDARELSRTKLSTELEQAHGRGRDCRRVGTALHLHYGTSWPGRWHCLNSREEGWSALTNK